MTTSDMVEVLKATAGRLYDPKGDQAEALSTLRRAIEFFEMSLGDPEEAMNDGNRDHRTGESA